MAFPLLLLYGLWRVWRFRPDCILTIYYDSVWILSSYWLSKLTGTPVVYYVHDPYLELAAFRGGINARLANWLERGSLRHGKTIVLYNSLREHYRLRYDVEATVVRHLAVRSAPLAEAVSTRVGTGRFVIGFAGTVYDNNRSLLKQLMAECKRNERIELRMWTNATAEVLEDLGANAGQVKISFESDYDKLLEALHQCDLLYLPLAFGDTPTMPTASLEYVLPTKAVDYLLVGKPILVHCPAQYEMSRFFREFGAGYCLSEDRPEQLADWLHRWAGGELPPIGKKDRQQALDQFSAERNSRALFDCLTDVARKR